MKSEMSRGLRHFDVNLSTAFLYLIFSFLATGGIYLIVPYIQTVQQLTIGPQLQTVSPHSFTMNIGSIIFCLLLVVISSLPKVTPNKPLSYFLRIISFFIGLPAVVYTLDSSLFTVSNVSHLSNVFDSTYTFAVITPLFLFLTTFFLPGNIWRKIIWVSIASFFMTGASIALPYLHMYALNHLAPFYIPVLTVFFDKLLLSLELVCFYGLVASQK